MDYGAHPQGGSISFAPGSSHPILKCLLPALVSVYLTDTVSMSRGLHYFLVEMIVFLCLRTEAIHLPSYFGGKRPGESVGKVSGGTVAEVVGIV